MLFVSRNLNIKRKNLKVVLDALTMVRRDVELHTVGNGNSSGFDHGYIGREELINLMHDMDILILPSIYEELGYVGLEAYSIGLPVVTSNIQSFQTIFTESPRFEPFNPFQLATIIDNLSPDSVEEMGRNSWNSVKKSNEIARKRLLSLYESVHSKK
jgi:glycosyltransferase involved in cell wall biosynthesis